MTRGVKSNIGDESIINGYLSVKVAEGRWELKHRQIVEEYLGRPLESHEYIRFKDGNKDNINIDNLEVCVKKSNTRREIEKLDRKIAELQDKRDRLARELQTGDKSS